MNSNLTVVVPVYNVERYLRKCVDSILAQTLHVDEIILVDDGSLDNSGRIADELAIKHAQIKVIHQQNGGLAAARNTGIDAATKKYIAFVDSDDYIDPHMYEVLMERLLKDKADMSICGVWYEQENGEKYTPYTDNVQKIWNKKQALIELNSYQYFNMSFCDIVFKRELFEITAYGEGALRFPVGKISEDFYLMHKVVARANTVTYTSEPLYHYVQRGNSISRNKKIYTAPMDASNKQLAFFKKWFPDLIFVGETACFFAHVSIYTAYCRSGQKCPDKITKSIDKVCHRYLKSVLKSPYIPRTKKAQALVYCYSKPIYRAVISRSAHR